MHRILCLLAVLGLGGCTYVYYPAAGQPAGSAYGGTVSPSAAAGPCREFSQTVTIDGRPVQATGYACQQQDGSWRVR